MACMFSAGSNETVVNIRYEIMKDLSLLAIAYPLHAHGIRIIFLLVPSHQRYQAQRTTTALILAG
jgi:hypothetical protein